MYLNNTLKRKLITFYTVQENLFQRSGEDSFTYKYDPTKVANGRFFNWPMGSGPGRGFKRTNASEKQKFGLL